MLPIFTKPLEDLSTSDLDELLREQYPESSTVEYKEGLQTRDGKPDPWLSGENQISNRARNKLLEEIVAFANAHGGTLLIGVKETKQKPPGAELLTPLPRAAELAEKIRLQARDCIEPQLPLLHSTAIKTDDGDSGVILVRVPASRAAPHRLAVADDLNCYIRRADRTEKMTMREIQDLTLHIERGLVAIENKFQERADKFRSRFVPSPPSVLQRIGARVTAIPLGELYLSDVYRRTPSFASASNAEIELDGRETRLILPKEPVEEKPQLRGTLRGYHDERWSRALEVFQDGVVEEHFVFDQIVDAHEAGAQRRPEDLPLSWVLACVLSVVRNLQAFRASAGAPEMEYGLEVEIISTPTPADLVSLRFQGDLQTSLGVLPGPDMLLPRYSVGGEDEFPRILLSVLRDCTDAVGFRLGTELLKIRSGAGSAA